MIDMTESLVNTKTGGSTAAAQVAVFAGAIREVPRTIDEKTAESAGWLGPRVGFVRRADNGTWNHVDTTMAHSGYVKTRESAGQLLRRRYERMVREGVI